MRSAVLATALVSALTGTAAAQPGLTPPAPWPAPMPYPAPAMPAVDTVSESTALWLSLGGTAMSWTILIAGLKADDGNPAAGRIAEIGAFGTLFAPTLGHWYAREIGTRGLGLRLAGVGALMFGAILVLGCEDECGSSGPAAGALLLGAGLYVAGTIDDIATAPSAARRYNQRFSGLAIVPMVRRDAAGVVLGARF
ncbi:MAG TPA: hypothetical protein VGD37_34655 [Kofleriaceae bacterium]|jgi:hypothetical protein